MSTLTLLTTCRYICSRVLMNHTNQMLELDSRPDVEAMALRWRREQALMLLLDCNADGDNMSRSCAAVGRDWYIARRAPRLTRG